MGEKEKRAKDQVYISKNPWFKEWVPLVLGVGSELEKGWPQAQSWNFWNV